MSQTLLVAAVVLAAVFACLAIVSSRKCAAALTQTRQLAAALHSLRSKIETHDAELDAVTDSLHQLRGKFYAERRKLQPISSNSDSAPEPTNAATVKDMLRRRAGLVAGRPTPHSEA